MVKEQDLEMHWQETVATWDSMDYDFNFYFCSKPEDLDEVPHIYFLEETEELR